ncbi:reverse transcriptase domain-containing protein [Tanacetum coccineum]
MPFSLKNASATYQRLVDKAFDNQVGRNIEVYVDDLVIKSHTESEMLRDIDETFRTPEGIKQCPDKTEAVLQLPSPRTIKEVQSLNGKLASLNRFLSKSAEKSLSLFKTLKKCIKKSDFYWTPEAEQVFKQLKQQLSEIPLLVAPNPKEELIVYLFASHGAISAVLMTERGTVQTSVYFVSRALQGLELNYTPMEKLILALVFAAKRLRRYFQAYPIAILADFLIEKPDEAPPDTFQFTTSNNAAEYEALIAGLRIAAQMGVRNVHVSVDSKLVANKVLGTYVAKEENMVKYLEKAKSLISGFANFFISQVLVEVLKEKSIQEEEVATVVEEEGPTWMTPIMEYLKDGTLLDDRKEARKLRIKARQYELLEGVLYRRSFLKPWLRKGQVFDNRYGLFHEVGRGESSVDNHRKLGEEVRVGQHSMPLRSPRGNSFGQWATDKFRLTGRREARAKLKMTKYYNARVLGVTFRPGDFVYRSNEESHAMDGGKLGPK